MAGRRLSVLRGILLGVVPFGLLLAGAFVLATGGRYVSSDNAYVKAHTIQISPEIDGRVAQVLVGENQQVDKGALLFSIDRRSFEIALASAEAELAGVKQKFASLRAHYQESLAEIEVAEERIRYLKLEVERQGKLKTTGFSASTNIEKAEHQLNTSIRTANARRLRNDMVVAELGGSPDARLEDYPLYLEAFAKRDQAELNLARTQVHAPASGHLSRVTLQPGEHVEAGAAQFALVTAGEYWIQVNIKEVKLTHVKAGLPATVVLDAYPNVEWAAVVDSISPATGAEFSLLPAQNATGNWVKVVQRVSLRLKLLHRANAPQLRAGLTATVSIDTGRERDLGAIAATLLNTSRVED